MDKQISDKGQSNYNEQNLGSAVNQGETGLSNLAYDWVTILHNKTKGLRACAAYLEDARKANAKECVDLLQRICDADRLQVEEIKDHVVQVLSGKMGTGQPGTIKAAGKA